MNRQNQKPGGTSNVLKTFLLIIAVILFGLIVARVLIPSRVSVREAGILKERCVTTRAKLSQIRYAIRHFYDENGKYPNSLNDLKRYIDQNHNPDWILLISNLKEYISSEEGTDRETSKLDGTGGWYYNKETGEVKVNLAKPVEFYLGDTVMSKDIPSEW